MSRLAMSGVERARVQVVMVDGLRYDIRLKPTTALIEVRREAIPLTASAFGGWEMFEPGEPFGRIELDGPIVRALRRDPSRGFRPRAAEVNGVSS